MKNLIKKYFKSLINRKGFKTKRKLIIFESDDWGSIRTKDRKTLNYLNKINPNIKNERFTQLDSIASEDDLSALFEVLNSVKDSNSNPACITANVCTANPDFKKIKDSGFNKFYFEKFTETLSKYSTKNNLFDLWNDGEKQDLFKPQLHGREHLHSLLWLKELKSGNSDLIKAFELNSFGIPYIAIYRQKRRNLQAALDKNKMPNEFEFQKKWFKDAVNIFKQSFGYYSSTFISPAYIWHNDMHKIFTNHKIKSLQGITIQYQPSNLLSKYRMRFHYTGQIDKKNGLLYTVRNCFFEPASMQEKDWVNYTLSQIDKSFDNNQPAIIGSHRINYIGRLNEKNRFKNLKMLKEILKKITKKHPDIEFISSSELIKIIQTSNEIN